MHLVHGGLTGVTGSETIQIGFCRRLHNRTHETAYHSSSHCWLAVGWSLDGRPDAAGSGVGGPVGGTLYSGLKKKYELCRGPCRVPKDPNALIVRAVVLTLVSWLNVQSGPHTIMVT